MREVIVVCYGNICRSPMGEVLLQRALDDRFGPGEFLVTSAGIAAYDGQPPSQGSVRAMAARDIDLRPLRSSLLTERDAARAWRIYCMEDYQVLRARDLLREDHDKVMLMGGEEVPDPIGSDQPAYEAVAEQLERLIPGVLDDIAVALEE